MSANRITISIYLGEDEVEYSCQYLKHSEGINRLYHSTCHIEYDAKDSNIDISSLKNNLAQIEAEGSIKARIEVNYIDLNKTLYIPGSVYASKTNSTSGSTLTTYVLYLGHETRPMTLSNYSGVSYQAQAKDIIERRLINQSETLNLSDYTEFFEKINYNNSARFPTHPMIVQWKQSTYAFMERVLGTHGLWYQLYSHKGGVDFVIGDNNKVFSGHSDEIKNDKDKGFYFDDQVTISLQNKQGEESAYQYQRLYNGSPIVDIAISPELFSDSQNAPKHYIDYQALKRKLSDKRSQQQNHQQLGAKLHREVQQSHKQHSALSTQHKKQTVSGSHQDYISRRHLDDAKKQLIQKQQSLSLHQSGQDDLQAEIDQFSKQLAVYENYYQLQENGQDKNAFQAASFRQFENISFYHANQETPSQEMTELLPLAITDNDKKVNPYITQDYSIEGDDYFPVVIRDQFEIMAQTQQEQIVWNNAPRFIASFQGYLLRAGTKVNVELNQSDDFPEADKKHFQDYPEYIITDVLYEYTAEKNQRGQAKVDSLGRVIHYQEKHTVMGSFPKCDYRPLVNYKKLRGEADYLTGVKPYQISTASFEIVPNKNGYIPISLPLDYQENIGSSCYYAPRVSSSNTGKMNQSHPIYPDTELSISFLNGNPEIPVIRGAVANKATGHVNSQSQDKRMMLTSPQGHTFSNTLNAGDDNSAALKTKHGYQSQKDGSHQSYFSLSNVGSTVEEGKKQLDITEATTAHKTLKSANKFEQYSGVTSNDTTQPNYGLIIDPNIEEPKSSPIVSKLAEVKDSIVSAVQTVAIPEIKKFDTNIKTEIAQINEKKSQCKPLRSLVVTSSKDKSRKMIVPTWGLHESNVYQIIVPNSVCVEQGPSACQLSCSAYNTSLAMSSSNLILSSDHGVEVESQNIPVMSPAITLSYYQEKSVNPIKLFKLINLLFRDEQYSKSTVKSGYCDTEDDEIEIQAFTKRSGKITYTCEFKKDKAKANAALEDCESRLVSAMRSIPLINRLISPRWTKTELPGKWESKVSGEIAYGNNKLKATHDGEEIAGLLSFPTQLLKLFSLLEAYAQKKGLNITIKYPKIKLELETSNSERQAGYGIQQNNSLALFLDPFIGADFKIDILDFLANWFGTPAFAAFLDEVRNRAREGFDAKAASGQIDFGIDFEVKSEIGTGKEGWKAEYNPYSEPSGPVVKWDKSDLNAKGCIEGKMTFSLTAFIEARLTVWSITASAGALAYLEASMGGRFTFEAKLGGQKVDFKGKGQLFFDGLIIYGAVYIEVTNEKVIKNSKRDAHNTDDGFGTDNLAMDTNDIKDKASGQSINIDDKDIAYRKDIKGQFTLIEPCQWPKDKTPNIDDACQKPVT